MTKQVQSIPKETKRFKANGNDYYVSDKISAARFKEYEKLVPRLTFGIGFDEMHKTLTQAFNYLNAGKPANAAILIHNVLNGIVDHNNPKRTHPAMMMAALVINRDGEDETKYDESVMLDKVRDWTEEGFDMLDFFELSLNSIQGFRETLLKYTQERLKEMIPESKE